MSLIIEGPDCAGKTTLIKTYFYDRCCIHNGRYPSPDAALREYLNQCPSSDYDNDNLVWDRNYISEQIYGSIYRSKNLPQTSIDTLEMRLKAIETVVILCAPPKQVIIDTWLEMKNKRGEYIHSLDYFEDIVLAYIDRISDYTSLPVVEYDYTNEKHDIKYLENAIKLVKEQHYG